MLGTQEQQGRPEKVYELRGKKEGSELCFGCSRLGAETGAKTADEHGSVPLFVICSGQASLPFT
jgi:hypothetical protein